MSLPDSSENAAAVAGVWIRLWEEDPLGDKDSIDRDTLVIWTQSPSGIYVDLRLPKDSPGRGNDNDAPSRFKRNPSALAANGAALLDFDGDDDSGSKELFSLLASQKSFAGVLNFAFGDTTNGEALAKDLELGKLANSKSTPIIPLNTCFWRRDCDYQPPTGGLDVGVCASLPSLHDDGSLDMRETGDDASYAEGWRRLAKTSTGPFCALKLISENGFARTGYWVRAGDHFAYAVGRPNDTESARGLSCPLESCGLQKCTGMSLEDAVLSKANGDYGEAIQLLLTYVVVAGTVENDTEWKISSSSHPELVGCTLLGGEASNCASVLHAKGDNKLEQTIDGTNHRRVWEIVELEGFKFST